MLLVERCWLEIKIHHRDTESTEWLKFNVRCSSTSPPFNLGVLGGENKTLIPKRQDCRFHEIKIRSKTNPNQQPSTNNPPLTDLSQGLVSGDTGSGGKVERAQPGIGLWNGDAVVLKFLV